MKTENALMIRRATIPKMNRFLLPILFTVLLVFAIVFDAMAENCDADLVVSWTPLEIITAGMPGEAIEKSAKANGLPVDRIIEVSVLDPYFYR